RLSVCFILPDNDNRVKGYYTLSSSSIEKKWLPETIAKKLPPSYQDLPVILLGRLAIASNYQGQRQGELLLLDALKRAFKSSKFVGSMAVVVDPLDEEAVKFYLRYGFILISDSGKMFLPMDTIAALFPEEV
ncbi:MAG: GNAT family N-acetyltransferase, partial [Flavisolibacter sp.]